MLVHRQSDERKWRNGSWIHELHTDAAYLVSSKATEHFSSSKGAEFNEAMKKRALEVILPSLFDIARSHEDYVLQCSGELNPRGGKLVTWQSVSRPDRVIRTQNWKQHHPEVKSEAPEDNACLEDNASEDTEPEEELEDCPSSYFSSFDSRVSYSEDVKMFPESIVIRSDSEPLVINMQPPTNALQHHINQPLDDLHQYGASGIPSTFNGDTPETLSYPYNFQMPPNNFHFAGPPAGSFQPPMNANFQPPMNDMSMTGLPMQMQEQPSHSVHGLPPHELSACGLPMQGLPMEHNWN